MQHFKDSASNCYAFEDDVRIVENIDGTFQFFTSCQCEGDDHSKECTSVALQNLPIKMVKCDPPKVTFVDPTEKIRIERNMKIGAVQWRYERFARETRLGIPTTDQLEKLDTYVQALCDIPAQKGFPDTVDWPDEV